MSTIEAVNTLFQRFPALLGFSVQGDKALDIAELAIHPWYDEHQRSSLRAEIVLALLDLIRRFPGARSRLRGRTFARSLH